MSTLDDTRDQFVALASPPFSSPNDGSEFRNVWILAFFEAVLCDDGSLDRCSMLCNVHPSEIEPEISAAPSGIERFYYPV